MSARRIRAIVRKELREYRRNRSIVVAMPIVALVFLIEPSIAVFGLSASDASSLVGKEPLVYMLGIPALIPAALAAYSVTGERQQGTLEPVLTTPIRAEEFLLAKALAVLLPALIVSYVVLGGFSIAVALVTPSPVASAVLSPQVVVAMIVFTPLVAALSIWMAIAISARVSDIRVAQQLSTLASLLLIVVCALVSVGTIHATAGLTLAFAAALLLLDGLGWRIVSPMFDRERLMTGTR